ncbi:hypothetical protein GCM10010255_04010 [Streptomyces coeruleofuscus]|uniref:Uncharacterized protein n=1 Tax=Streptomyces coeruleofuscus TaxID=66879 RepID=A0ABP5UIT4_9ACTN
MTFVTRGQLPPSRAHPRTAFRSPEHSRGAWSHPTIKEGYSGSGRRCSRMGRVVLNRADAGARSSGASPAGVSGFMAAGLLGTLRLVVGRSVGGSRPGRSAPAPRRTDRPEPVPVSHLSPTPSNAPGVSLAPLVRHNAYALVTR